ncbi:Mobile element protein [Rhodococcus aetherivorans]|nr:Mobile element protein [Rhodococcus aetherivorans]
MKKSDRDIMEILEAYDATGSAHSAAQLAGVDPKTVRRYVAARDAGMPVTGTARRPRIIDDYLPKIEEWVERSKGRVRADIVHERLVELGFDGTERTTRRAVAQAKTAWQAGHRRTYRPWLTEPGLWMQFDWGAGPKVPGPGGIVRSTLLFCAWLAWSRFRVVIEGVGSDVADADRVPRCHGASLRWGADLRADRQSPHRQHRPRCRHSGAAPADGRDGPALRHGRAHLHPLRSGIQGRQRSHRQDRQGGSGTHRGEPAAGLRLLHRPRGRV